MIESPDQLFSQDCQQLEEIFQSFCNNNGNNNNILDDIISPNLFNDFNLYQDNYLCNSDIYFNSATIQSDNILNETIEQQLDLLQLGGNNSLHIINEESSSVNSDYSILGVDLDLFCNNIDETLNLNTTSTSTTSDNLYNWVNDLNQTSDQNIDEYLANDGCSNCNYLSDNNVQIEILNRFPHIIDERNLKRRSRLYENSSNINTKNKDNDKYVKNILSTDTRIAINNRENRRKTDEEKYFPCSIVNCEKVYSKSSHLKAHLRRHSGEKPFICNWANCTWKFSRSDELARHKRSHSGIKPYKCELCEKAFARSDHLSKHRKVHKKRMGLQGTYFLKK